MKMLLCGFPTPDRVCRRRRKYLLIHPEMSVKKISFHLKGISEMRGIQCSGGDFDVSPRDGQAQEIFAVHLERLDHSAAQVARAGVSLPFHGCDAFMITGRKHTSCQKREG
jgi:hypothetical protein